ncbi:hypothetical protein FCJ61_05785 [Burkholderia metallica]|nr:hypothetical protein [Burkholderia metallica]
MTASLARVPERSRRMTAALAYLAASLAHADDSPAHRTLPAAGPRQSAGTNPPQRPGIFPARKSKTAERPLSRHTPPFRGEPSDALSGASSAASGCADACAGA